MAAEPGEIFSVIGPDPPVDTLSQFRAGKAGHLLAGISLAPGKCPYAVTVKADRLGKIGQDKVHRHLLTMILDIVIHHNHNSFWAHNAPEFSDDDRHLEEVFVDEGQDTLVAQLRLPCPEDGQHLMDSPLIVEHLYSEVKRPPVPFVRAFWLSFWGCPAEVCAGAALHPSAEGWRAEKSS